MRSCLLQLLISVGVIFALLWFGLPFGASWLATNALTASGFTGTNTQVQVQADLPPRILAGHADSVHVTSDQVSVGDLHSGTIDLTLKAVDLFDRKIGTASGTMTGVKIFDPTGQPVTFDKVTVSGDAKNASSTLTISNAEVARLAAAQLKANGVNATVALAAPDKVTVTTAGSAQACRLRVTNGSLILVPDGKALPTLPLMAPGNGNPFQITSATVGSAALTLTGTIDLQTLLGI